MSEPIKTTTGLPTRSGCLFVGFTAGLISGSVLGMLLGADLQRCNTMDLKKEAVERGYAIYEAYSDGQVAFKWKGTK